MKSWTVVGLAIFVVLALYCADEVSAGCGGGGGQLPKKCMDMLMKNQKCMKTMHSLKDEMEQLQQGNYCGKVLIKQLQQGGCSEFLQCVMDEHSKGQK